MSGRYRLVRSIGLMFCMMFGLGVLAGCDRSQAPGPGPKPISSNASPPANANAGAGAGASAPPAAPR
jgi:hypothetical protein